MSEITSMRPWRPTAKNQVAAFACVAVVVTAVAYLTGGADSALVPLLAAAAAIPGIIAARALRIRLDHAHAQLAAARRDTTHDGRLHAA
ncbi:MAG: hypothetical protein JWO67_3976 [Streptosporangiaceae bacterium]|nr:hypothetical protein [Streptosporangiaceae bacterium]